MVEQTKMEVVLDKTQLLEVLEVELVVELIVEDQLDLVELQDHLVVVLVELIMILELVAVELLVKVEIVEVIVLVGKPCDVFPVDHEQCRCVRRWRELCWMINNCQILLKLCLIHGWHFHDDF